MARTDYRESHEAAQALAARLAHLPVEVLDYSRYNGGKPWFYVVIRDAGDPTLQYTVTPDGERVGLGGEMDLPLHGFAAAWEAAGHIAEACGYLARRCGSDQTITCYLREGPPVRVAYGDDDNLVAVRALPRADRLSPLT